MAKLIKFISLLLLISLFLGACQINQDPWDDIVQVQPEGEVDMEPLFLQGLELIDGKILISAGLYGKSKIGFLDDRGKLQVADILGEGYFAEGLTVDEKYVYQLTWKEHMLFVRDRQTLKVADTWIYRGEGWGIAFDGENLIRSDGSNKLFIHDREDFALLKSVECEFEQLNELEYVEGSIYANIWKSDLIAKIDPETGDTLAIYDLGSIADNHRGDIDSVLNGIAHIQDDLFYVGGKNWDKLYKVRLP